MTATTLGPPTLPAYPTPHGWKIWCIYCRRWHQHGAESGHRVAHCHVATSPYRRTGYVLELAPDVRIRPKLSAHGGTS